MKLLIQGVEYEGESDSLSFGEMIRIEKVTALKFRDFSAGLVEGSPLCIQAFVWALMRRSNSELRLSDIEDLTMADVVVVAEPGEEAQADEEAAKRPRNSRRPTTASG